MTQETNKEPMKVNVSTIVHIFIGIGLGIILTQNFTLRNEVPFDVIDFLEETKPVEGSND